MSSVQARRAHGIDRLGPKIVLVWAGLAIGVAFVATPAKLLVPSLDLAVALDIGRHTFQVYNGAELVLLLLLAILGVWSKTRWRWYRAFAIPAAIVIAQAVWLIPALDDRVAVILARPSLALPHSSLHSLYIAAEAVKIAVLLGWGLAEPSWRGRTSPWRKIPRPAQPAIRTRRPGPREGLDVPILRPGRPLKGWDGSLDASGSSPSGVPRIQQYNCRQSSIAFSCYGLSFAVNSLGSACAPKDQ